MTGADGGGGGDGCRDRRRSRLVGLRSSGSQRPRVGARSLHPGSGVHVGGGDCICSTLKQLLVGHCQSAHLWWLASSSPFLKPPGRAHVACRTGPLRCCVVGELVHAGDGADRPVLASPLLPPTVEYHPSMHSAATLLSASGPSSPAWRVTLDHHLTPLPTARLGWLWLPRATRWCPQSGICSLGAGLVCDRGGAAAFSFGAPPARHADGGPQPRGCRRSCRRRRRRGGGRPGGTGGWRRAHNRGRPRWRRCLPRGGVAPQRATHGARSGGQRA